METNYNRLQADLNQVDVLLTRYQQGSDSINFLLQAQRQLVNSASDFYRSLSDYNLAIRNFHREKGSLLSYNQIQLAEAAWKKDATVSAHRVGRHLVPRKNKDQTLLPPNPSANSFNPSEIQATSKAPEGESAEKPANVREVFVDSLPDHVTE